MENRFPIPIENLLLQAEEKVVARENTAALDILYVAEKRLETDHKKENYTRIYTLLGVVEHDLKHYQKALSYFRDVLRFSQLHKLPLGITYRNIAYVEQSLELFAKAEKGFNIALKELTKEDNQAKIAVVQNDFAKLFFVQKRYSKSLRHSNEAIVRYQEKQLKVDKFFGLAHINKGKALQELMQLEVAETAFLKALDIFDGLQLEKVKIDAYEQLYELYRKQNRSEDAFKMLEKFHHLKVEKLASEHSYQIVEAEVGQQNKKQGEEVVFQRMFIDTQQEMNKKLQLQNEQLQREIEKRRAKEHELKELNDELERFISIASHDMRAPLRSITSYSGLLRRRLKDIDQLEYVNFIETAGINMEKMLSSLLKYARAGLRLDELKPINPNDAVLLAKQNLKTHIEEKNALITSDELPVLNGTNSLFIQIFQNVLGNAVKYQPDNQQPIIKIKYTKIERKNGLMAQISVQDNGIGIEKKQLEEVFEPFRRLGQKNKFEGTGIGMATVKKLVNNLAGTIHLESEIGKGTSVVMRFILPQNTEEDA